jgi:hypothetical protein
MKGIKLRGHASHPFKRTHINAVLYVLIISFNAEDGRMKGFVLDVIVMLQYHKTTDKKGNKLMIMVWMIPLYEGQLIF